MLSCTAANARWLTGVFATQASTRSSAHLGQFKPRLSSLSLSGNPKILGIETSCDDSGVAIVDSRGKVIAEALSSQWELHAKYGGVMPTMAARAHEANLPTLIDDVLSTEPKFDAVAVTTGPGLTPCLRVGLAEARRIARLHDVPLIPVNHLEGHLLSSRIPETESQEGSQTADQLGFPHLSLVVSGGHCMIVLVADVGKYVTLGATLDDSIGEAFDKVARMLGCSAEGNQHPGAVLEALAAKSRGEEYEISMNLPLQRVVDCNFSFSGLKTQVVRHIENFQRIGSEPQDVKGLGNDKAGALAYAFQSTAVKHLAVRTVRALAWVDYVLAPHGRVVTETAASPEQSRFLRKFEQERNRIPHDMQAKIQAGLGLVDGHDTRIKGLVVCGGVARNQAVRMQLSSIASQLGIPLVSPPLKYCTDNAVMIAWAAQERLKSSSLTIEEIGVPELDAVNVRGRWPVDELLV